MNPEKQGKRSASQISSCPLLALEHIPHEINHFGFGEQDFKLSLNLRLSLARLYHQRVQGFELGEVVVYRDDSLFCKRKQDRVVSQQCGSAFKIGHTRSFSKDVSVEFEIYHGFLPAFDDIYAPAQEGAQ